jgi:hypothetical protein
MKKIETKIFKNTPFVIESEEIDNGSEFTPSSRVAVYRDDILIGKYIRNSPLYATFTFFPFKHANEWYALYSADYTKTCVMKLLENNIIHWCDDSNNSLIYPVEYFIHSYDNNEQTKFCNFGFVSGLVRDDVSLWKLQYIDLSKVYNKKMTISERFGDWPLPINMGLKDCVDMSGWDISNNISLLTTQTFNLKEKK